MNKNSSPVRVAIAGATGYAGQGLLSLLARHPEVQIVSAMSSSPDSAARPLPRLARTWDGKIEPLNRQKLTDATYVFLAVPEAAAADLAPGLLEAGVRVIDLSGAFRIKYGALRAKWYPATTLLPDGVAYGLVEHNRAAIENASLIACPGYAAATNTSAHVVHRTDGHAVGGYVGFGSIWSQTLYMYGLEGQIYMPNATIGGVIQQASTRDGFDYDAWDARVTGSYFMSDQLAFNGSLRTPTSTTSTSASPASASARSIGSRTPRGRQLPERELGLQQL